MVIVIKIIIKLLLRKTFTKMQTPPRTPSPLRLPPVCPGAPVKNETNQDKQEYDPPGNFALNLGPTLERVNERFTTPPRQRTVSRNLSPQRPEKKKR